MDTPVLTLEQLGRHVDAGEIDTVIVGFTDQFGRLMGKRFDAGFFLADVAEHGTHACDYLFTVNMAMEPVDGYAFAGWEHGYGDVHLIPDMSTLRRAAWTPSSALVLCDLDATIAPRRILRSQIERLNTRGVVAKAASELEFYVYRDSFGQNHRRGYADLRPNGWYSEDYDLLHGARQEDFVGASRRALAASGIPVENSKGETGVGQHELNIEYADVLAMADRHAVMKHAMKEVAIDHGVSVTFMAKPVTDDAGSSCHIHLSLWEGDTNVFAAPDGSDGHSDRFRWFLGGWMAHVNELMVWYAPTINSYKRYVAASWAPTSVAWATDNRTAGFRVVGSGPSLRIECRLPGADVNPYLAFAASLAAGMDGIEHHTEPPPEFDGNVYSAELPPLPGSLAEAVTIFDGSVFARSSFGDDVVDHYVRFYRNEVTEYERAVTDWERAQYFERI